VRLGCEGAVAARHAGWRGLAGGVLEEGVRALRELGGAGAIAAVIGPGAGPCCYEVGEEVHGAFGAQVLPDQAPADERVAVAGYTADETGLQQTGRRRKGHRRSGRERSDRQRAARNIDLPALARERLVAAGVERIEQVGLCTICDGRFYSHRREGLGAGRQAGVAWLG
jgi:copper oxidase (laccase) domain-containing protein